MQFAIDDRSPLIDDPVAFRIIELEPGQEVRLVASWELAGVAFESSGLFEADARGVVSPCEHPSLGGTYRGVDARGLWWSAGFEGDVAHTNLDPIVTTLSATTDTERADATITRHFADPTVEVTSVSEGGLVGMYFRPEGEGSHPAVMVVGGSGGGFNGADVPAGLLASRGFATLALAYFGLPGLPNGLVDVPLEYFASGLRWLQARPEVTGRVGVLGQSRGGELALLLGATFPQIGAVVARVPSGVVWGGFGPGAGPESAAWTLDGRAVPWLPTNDDSPEWAEVYKSSPLVCTPGALADLSHVEAARKAEIKIERASCPIMMISGEDDALWPSTTLAELAEKRAHAHGFVHRLIHLRYPDAGHFCATAPGLPSPLVVSHPVDHELIALGGSLQGNAAAQADSWPRTLDFLHDVLVG